MIIEKNDQTVQDDQYRDSFNLLFNQIEDYLFILDETGQIIRVNKAAIEKLEYSLEEMLNMNIERLYPLTRGTEVKGILKGMLEGSISQYLMPLCTKLGKQIPVETRVFKGKWEGKDVLYGISKDSSTDAFFLGPKLRGNIPSKIVTQGRAINCEVLVRNELSNVHYELFSAEMTEVSNNNYFLTTTSNITNRRKQEKDDQRLKNIQMILEAMPFLAWMKDKQGKYVAINRAFEDFYKMKTTEIVDKSDFDIFSYKIALEHRNNEEEVIKTKSQQFLNRLHVKNKDSEKWFGVTILPFFEINGDVAGTIGISNDITEQVQLEIELANQRRFLKTILDTIPDYIFYKDIDSVYLGCNKANAEKVLGVTEDEVIGKTFLDITENIEQAKIYHQKDQETYLAGKALKFEERIVLTDGSEIDVERVETPFLNEQGNVAGLIGISRDITERKRFEKQLRKQAEYAELLFKTVPSAVLSVDKDRKIIRWNKIAEEITGYSEAEAMGKECSMILHGVGVAGCSMCGKIIDSPLINQKCVIVNKGGQIRHVLKSVAVLKDEFGEISEKMECLEDITEMTDIQAELSESKERYAAIVNNAPQIVVIHKKGIIEFINDAGIEVLGYKENECIGRHMKEFMTGDSLTRVDSALSARAEGEVGAPYEIELIKKSGEIINVLLKGADIAFESEAATLAVMMDITEGKRLNTKLRESEERFRQFAETINEIFLIADKDKIVYVSPAYERITGTSCESLLDNPHALVELIHSCDRIKMQISFAQSFLNMNEATSAEFRICRPDGEMRWLWLQSYPVLNAVNNNPLKVSSIVDITDRKKVEEKLRERERQTQMELLLAAQVQKDSLPHPFAGDQVRVSSIFEPYSKVSGDFFNYKWFEEQKKLCGYIIDVSGHGVATALQTATFKMMLDNVLLTGETIEEGHLQIINQKVMPYLYEDSFVALLYFEFDLKAAVLKLISAGITLFLAAKPHECSLVPISGCYLGIIDDPDIEMVTVPLKEGEIYCMMSDGVSDLIELHGISKQDSFTEYTNWFEKLAVSPDRNDDFSVICIEILQVNKETKVLDIKNDGDLVTSQKVISEFLERNAPSLALQLEVAINEAVNNAFYCCGRVLIKMRRMGRKLIIRVKDFGLGFNIQEVNVQLKKDMYEKEFDELLEAEGGRGILLMRLFCDKVIYNAMGNEVLLMKQI